MIEDGTGQNPIGGGGGYNGGGGTGAGTPGDTGNGIDPGAQTNGPGGGGVPPLPASQLGDGMGPALPAGGTSFSDPYGFGSLYDPSTWATVANTGGGGALANILRTLFSGSNNQGLNTLLKALAGVGGALGGRALANNAAQQAVPPQLTSLLNMGVNRAQYQNPLFQAVNQGVYDMLPNFSKTGNPGLDPSVLNRNG